jgi:hypothetical protein
VNRWASWGLYGRLSRRTAGLGKRETQGPSREARATAEGGPEVPFREGSRWVDPNHAVLLDMGADKWELGYRAIELVLGP